MIEKEKEIDVEFPYYYKHNLYSDYGNDIIYGYLTETKDISIQECNNYNGDTTYSIEITQRDDSYFKEEYRGTKKDFEAVKKRAMNFLNNL